MGAETYDVDLGHSGRKIAENPTGNKRDPFRLKLAL
jgi:hypothetical protein